MKHKEQAASLSELHRGSIERQGNSPELTRCCCCRHCAVGFMRARVENNWKWPLWSLSFFTGYLHINALFVWESFIAHRPLYIAADKQNMTLSNIKAWMELRALPALSWCGDESPVGLSQTFHQKRMPTVAGKGLIKVLRVNHNYKSEGCKTKTMRWQTIKMLHIQLRATAESDNDSLWGCHYERLLARSIE